MESLRSIWNRKNNFIISVCSWIQSRKNVRYSKQKEIIGGEEAVFDIINCGPNNRFTIRGIDGRPFIVHNCVQHLARCVLMDMMMTIKHQHKLAIANTVHDELIYIVDEDKAEQVLADVQAVMRTPPVWWPKLVVWSEGSTGETYGSAK